MFDRAALARRLGPLSPKDVKVEQRQRTMALQCFHRGDIFDERLPDALLRAYFMVLEDDGKNKAQLLGAGLLPLLQSYIRQRLGEGSADNDGWPLESETNTLAVVLFFLLSSQASIQGESAETNSEILRALAPYTFAGFRYSCIHTNVADTSPDRKEHRTNPRFAPQVRHVTYFGRPLTFQPPPVASFAILSYFARLEAHYIPIPPHLPKTRDEANATGREGPTRDDVEYFITSCRTHFLDWGLASFPAAKGSRRYEPCWARATRFSKIPGVTRPPLGFYEPGTLEGRWQGSYIAPFAEVYSSWLAKPVAPSSFKIFGRQPCFFTLREYYCYCPSLPVPDEQDGDSWLTSCRWTTSEDDDGIDISDDRDSYKAHYRPIRNDTGSGEGDPRLLGALHVIVAGKTESQYGDAWGAYKVIGHIRPSDGMVTLLRENNDPRNSGLGRSILRGYVTSSQNFVGRWEHASVDADVPAWEAPFSLCKENLQHMPPRSPRSDHRSPVRQCVRFVSRAWSHWRYRMASPLNWASFRYNSSTNFADFADTVRQ